MKTPMTSLGITADVRRIIPSQFIRSDKTRQMSFLCSDWFSLFVIYFVQDEFNDVRA